MKGVFTSSKVSPGKSVAMIATILLSINAGAFAEVQTPAARAAAASAVPDSPEKTRLLKIVEQCDEAIASNSGNFKAYVDRAHAFFDLGNFALAAEDLSWALQLNPTDGRWFIWRAKCYSKLDKDDLAMADANQAIKMASDSVPAYLTRGDLFVKSKQYSQAIADYTKAISIDGKNAVALTKRAAAYKASGDETDAEKDTQAAAAIAPPPVETTVASTTTGATDDTTKQNASVTIATTDSTTPTSDPATALKTTSINLKEIIFGKFENPEKSVQNLTAAISVSPLDQSLIYKRAQAYIQLGKLDNALNDLMNAIQNNPNNSNLYIARAWLYDTMGNPAMAQQDVTQAHFCNPTLSKDVTLDNIAATHLKKEKSK
ncbi:MAG: tetratricopeptide repeat protein [Candidatus Obscuribacterales bacterium]|nr:tetratricopeptide repeat protein [Candidatus Obscuribacterales bacterium]